jgi:hypothetical protein
LSSKHFRGYSWLAYQGGDFKIGAAMASTNMEGQEEGWFATNLNLTRGKLGLTFGLNLNLSLFTKSD